MIRHFSPGPPRQVNAEAPLQSLEQPKVASLNLKDPLCPLINWDESKSTIIIPRTLEGLKEKYQVQGPLLMQPSNAISEGCALLEFPEGLANQQKGSLDVRIYNGFIGGGNPSKSSIFDLPYVYDQTNELNQLSGLHIDSTINRENTVVNREIKPFMVIINSLTIRGENIPRSIHVNQTVLTNDYQEFKYQIAWDDFNFNIEEVNGVSQKFNPLPVQPMFPQAPLGPQLPAPAIPQPTPKGTSI